MSKKIFEYLLAVAACATLSACQSDGEPDWTFGDAESLTVVATLDGSAGTKGYVTDVIDQKNLNFDYFYGCGPLGMLKAISAIPKPGQLSLECRMGCGFGVCMCCSLETADGVKRICKDGPVFDKEELIWK